MRLITITCSGANEHTEISFLVPLIDSFTRAEIGVQVREEKGGFATARYWWLRALHSYLLYNRFSIPISLHLNGGWVEDFCQGNVAPELENFLFKTDYNKNPFIRRVQLNFKIGREKTPDMRKLYEAVRRFPDQRFVLSYNQDNEEFIRKLYKTGLKFDLLADNSFGEGILPENRPTPLFKDVLQGYAGGLGPDNVLKELDKIATVMPLGCTFFIDAEGRLKGYDGRFSLQKCKLFLERAEKWDEF